MDSLDIEIAAMPFDDEASMETERLGSESDLDAMLPGSNTPFRAKAMGQATLGSLGQATATRKPDPAYELDTARCATMDAPVRRRGNGPRGPICGVEAPYAASSSLPSRHTSAHSFDSLHDLMRIACSTSTTEDEPAERLPKFIAAHAKNSGVGMFNPAQSGSLKDWRELLGLPMPQVEAPLLGDNPSAEQDSAQEEGTGGGGGQDLHVRGGRPAPAALPRSPYSVREDEGADECMELYITSHKAWEADDEEERARELRWAQTWERMVPSIVRLDGLRSID